MLRSQACPQSLLASWLLVGWEGSATNHGTGAWAQAVPGCSSSPAQAQEQPTRRAHGWGCRARLHGGGGNWSWAVVCGWRRNSSHQLHLDGVMVTDCQGLEEDKRQGGVTPGLGELCAPHSTGGTLGVAVVTVRDPSGCWTWMGCPQPWSRGVLLLPCPLLPVKATKTSHTSPLSPQGWAETPNPPHVSICGFPSTLSPALACCTGSCVP